VLSRGGSVIRKKPGLRGGGGGELGPDAGIVNFKNKGERQ